MSPARPARPAFPPPAEVRLRMTLDAALFMHPGAGRPLRGVVANGGGVAWRDRVPLAFGLAGLPSAAAGSPVAAQ